MIVSRGMLVVLALLCVPVAYAVSIGAPATLDEENEIRAGNEYAHTFVIKGDAEDHNVRFFVRPIKKGLFTIEGKETYERELNLDEYEEESLTLDFEGVKAGETKVMYGLTYLATSGSGVGFEQTLQDSFMMEVKGSVAPPPSSPVTTTKKTSGSGSGGAAPAPVSTPTPAPVRTAEDQIEPEENFGADGGVMQDVAPQGSALTEGVVQPKKLQDRVVSVVQEIGSVADDEGAKTALFVVMFSWLAVALTSAFALRVARGDE
jgi:hypothetical protein